ncbi:rhomboid family intramembrane serine protease [Marinomonas sp.]|nr:rhomboid family intramembrane serine protease [Marinomonas sp.]MDB4836939.1 rhomboid family intramembrane serine protease [Marinomonas sp.]
MFKRFLPKDAIWFVCTIWLVFVIDFLLIGINLNQFGIRPRSIGNLPGILFSPFLHGGLYHIFSNTIPILILGALINGSVGSTKLRSIMIGGAIGSGLGVWLFSSGGLVVGASGIVFALLGFLLADAIYNPSIRSWLFAVISFFAYGGALFSFVSFLPHISWAAHFWGFATGIFLAYLLKSKND